jgi:hypothetical protein
LSHNPIKFIAAKIKNFLSEKHKNNNLFNFHFLTINCKNLLSQKNGQKKGGSTFNAVAEVKFREKSAQN